MPPTWELLKRKFPPKMWTSTQYVFIFHDFFSAQILDCSF